MKIVYAMLFIFSMGMGISAWADQININTASSQEISKALKGIGIKKADLIVEYRKQHGKFKNKEELVRVKGIGRKLVELNQKDIKFE